MKPEKKRSRARGGDDPARGLKRDSRLDGRRRFGLRVTTQLKVRSSGNLGKAFSYTKWYASERQREQAIEAEKKNCRKPHFDGGRGFDEIKSFELLERP